YGRRERYDDLQKYPPFAGAVDLRGFHQSGRNRVREERSDDEHEEDLHEKRHQESKNMIFHMQVLHVHDVERNETTIIEKREKKDEGEKIRMVEIPAGNRIRIKRHHGKADDRTEEGDEERYPIGTDDVLPIVKQEVVCPQAELVR